MPPKLVTVVVPAYNAATTIDETLRSLRAQTHAELDIIVVDDGSTDTTAEIALRHARRDARIRVVQQRNSGVAAARNHGIALARSELIAPVDADDLWRADKIERQLQALHAGGPRVGLVYTWYALIDERGRILSVQHRPEAEGDVLAEMCRGNLIGNGSAALMRRAAILEAGGYDTTIPGGCVDLKLYFNIAERYHFAVVRDHLTGYRRSRGNMSSKALPMLHAYDAVMLPLQARYPTYEAEFRFARNIMLRSLLRTALGTGAWDSAAQLVQHMFTHDRRFAFSAFAFLPGAVLFDWLGPRGRRSLEAVFRPRREVRPLHFLTGPDQVPAT